MAAATKNYSMMPFNDFNASILLQQQYSFSFVEYSNIKWPWDFKKMQHNRKP